MLFFSTFFHHRKESIGWWGQGSCSGYPLFSSKHLALSHQFIYEVCKSYQEKKEEKSTEWWLLPHVSGLQESHNDTIIHSELLIENYFEVEVVYFP